MAAVFTLTKRQVFAHRGHGQNGKIEELTVVAVGSANDATTYELTNGLNKVEHVAATVVGTSVAPYVDELANLDPDGAIKANGTSVTIGWSEAPKATTYFFRTIGF